MSRSAPPVKQITISSRAGSAGESGHRRSGCHTPLAPDAPGCGFRERQMAAAPADGPCSRAEGQNELALHLLGELDSAAQSITLTQWTPALLFEVKSRRLRLLRMKATRSETDKSRLQPEMDLLLSGLIALDPPAAQCFADNPDRIKLKGKIWQRKAFIWCRATKRPAAGEYHRRRGSYSV